MSETEQALQELDRLQAIVTRHEGHMFALRGWLLAIVGGLLAAYYTDNIDVSETVLRVALLGVPVLFLLLESRHVNIVEAVVERVGIVEGLMMAHRRDDDRGWYEGPRVNATCLEGALRWWPRRGMTFRLNQSFYGVVILVTIFAVASLPPREASPSAPAPSALSVPN